MSTPSELIQAAINATGLAQGLSSLQMAVLELAAKQAKHQDPDELLNDTGFLLNSAGPAMAQAAMDYSISACRQKGHFKNISFTGNMGRDLSLIRNDSNGIGESTDFTSTLRQFLLPRYAYVNFDTVVDPRHQIDSECGYPRYITPIMYRFMYDRDDMARRVVDIYPDESFAVDPDVYEDQDENTLTSFEEDWQSLCEEQQIVQYLYRMDKLSGVGHYGSLLIGLDDGKELDQPVDEPELLAGVKNSIGKKQRKVLYFRPFDEYLSFINEYDADPSSPRCGLPNYYTLVFLDMAVSAGGSSIGSRVNRKVHWSRVVHIADNLHTSNVFGTPRQQPVFNRLLDLRKIKGGSAEMLWKGGFPGISFEIDPRVIADDPEFSRDEFKDEIRRYSDGLQRYLTLVGIKANSLAPAVADPKPHVEIQVQAISSHFGVPIRIFLGSEEGRLASSQDKLTWNQRIGRRLRVHVEPNVVRNTVDRLIALGCMRPPALKGKKRRYFCGWGDLNTVTDEDKANLALKWTQALSQYVATGIIHFISPMDYMTMILGLSPRDALKIDQYIKSSGGYDKLKKVDPSQPSGENQQGIKASRQSNDASRSKTPKRNTADKQSEGKSS